MKIELEIETRPKEYAKEIQASSTEKIVELDEVQAIKDAIQEHFLFIGMDRRNNVRSIRLLGIGNCKKIPIDSKDIIRNAITTASDKVILVHNHPANSLEPTREDKYITNYVGQLLRVFNIELIDHIIVTEKDYCSMGKNIYIDNDFSDNRIDYMKNIFLREENEKLKEELDKQKQKKKYKEDR